MSHIPDRAWCPTTDAIRYNKRTKRWHTVARTLGARTFKRFSAETYETALVFYLSRNFDRQSLLCAADSADDREAVIARVNSVRYRNSNRKDNTTDDTGEATSSTTTSPQQLR